MIRGIGTAIVMVEDLRRKMEQDDGFSTRTFVSSEIDYCCRMADPWSRFGARLASKHAVMKALGTSQSDGMEFTDIVIGHEPGGSPEVDIRGESAEEFRQSGARLTLSISHSGGMALAFVVLFDEQ